MAPRNKLRILLIGTAAAVAALRFVVPPAREGAAPVGPQGEREAIVAALAPAQREAVAVPQAEPAEPETWTIEGVNKARLPATLSNDVSAPLLKAQVLVDRAGFSPGAIDARINGNFRSALDAFREQHGIEETAVLDQATWDALVATSAEPVLMEYAITQADTKGPFAPDIPDAIENWSNLRRLSYRDPGELLAEKFHMDKRLLAALNPGAAFDQPGTRILVARVGAARPPRGQSPGSRSTSSSAWCGLMTRKAALSACIRLRSEAKKSRRPTERSWCGASRAIRVAL